tara:strand:+ start:3694 stop:7878 length:4185 start_codon:yes stop_codon:yes gene_type:complete
MNEEEQIASTGFMDTDPYPDEEQLETIEGKPVFAAPFGYSFGNSSVDLNVKENHDTMKDEYNAYWNLPRGEERVKAQEDFNQKYFGMSTEEVRANQRQVNLEANNPIKRLDNTFQGLSAYGLGTADFVMDAAGTLIPGMGKVDDWWDKKTKLDNPTHTAIRRLSSLVIPGILGGNAVQGQINAKFAGGALLSKPWFQKLLATGTAHGVLDMGITYLNDISEEQTMTDDLSQMFPKTFGPGGRIPLIDFFRTNDSDSPQMRKLKNTLEAGPFAAFGSAIGGYADLSKGKKVMDWMEPLDDAAQAYKQINMEFGDDTDAIIRLQEIDELLSLGTENMSRATQDLLINEKIELEDLIGRNKNMDDVARREEAMRTVESEAAVDNKLNPDYDQLELDINVDGLDPDLNSNILDDAAKAKQSVPPGNVARNMADTTAIKNGSDFSTGDPAPIITDSMRRKGLMVGPTSRGAVMGVAEEARDAGRFNAIVDGIRYGTKEMNAAAWGIFNDIISVPTVDDLRDLFATTKDVKNLLGGLYRVEYAPEDTIRATAFAVKYLFDRFLGRPIAESSARVMDTLGREVDTLAGALDEMAPSVDRNRAMDLIIGKLEFLLDEYALNKYISGWQLRNKNWFDQTPPASVREAVDTLTEEFTEVENSIHAKNRAFTRELKRLQKENPVVLKPLLDAFSHTNGDVDSQVKLMKWAADQITPLGLLRSPDPENMNLFAKAVWAVRYNNMLSGISAFNAGLGNSLQLLTKTLTVSYGHLLTIPFKPVAGFTGLKRAFYYNTALYETNKRAITDAYRMMKKMNNDPQAMLSAARKDYVFKTDKAWNIMEDMIPVYEATGNWGRAYQFKVASNLKQLAGMKAMRYGMTGMVFPDVFTASHTATHISRLNAYTDVLADQGWPNMKMLKEAELENYSKYFDENGLIKNDVVKALTGDIALNTDDALSNYLTKATTAFPILKEVMAFPRTASNYMKIGLSYTPVSAIPNMNKFSKTIYAVSDSDIAEALLEHGIDMSKTPNARVIFEDLRAEYIGRQALANTIVGTLYGYAVGGNIRGNLHYNAKTRRDQMNQGLEPKTIWVPGLNKWVSYKGWIGIEHVLAPLGDLAMYMKDADEHIIESWQSKISWTIGATFLNDTPLYGLEKVFDILNGNERAFSQFIAGAASSMVPLSGALNVVSNAIHQAQRNIETDIGEFFKNRLPGLKGTVPIAINPIDGLEIKDAQNPALGAFNAASPVKFHDEVKPYMQFLHDIKYGGLGAFKYDSTGSYEWSAEDQEKIYRLTGAMNLEKEIMRIANRKDNQEIINDLINLRNEYHPGNDVIKLKARLSPVHRELDLLINNAIKVAELEYLRDKPLIQQAIVNAQLAKNRMKQGDVSGAAELQKKDAQIKNLIQHGN